jgi:uncharacterized phage protein gp47/JayE
MSLNISPSNQKERALIFLKTLLNNTNNVSKVSDHSILDAIADGVAKISIKAEIDVFLALSQLFPDNSYGSNLDLSAELFGISPRFGASGSSTYLRLVGITGTTYLANTQIFGSKDGLQFSLENDVTIGAFGFEYVKVRSIDTGVKTNIDSGRIDSVNPQPTGHQYVINEYICTGGRDAEDDETFQQRIKQGSNVLATSTLAMLEQVFMSINNNVLRIFYQGHDSKGRIKIAIVTQNGIDLNASELDTILDQGNQFFGLSQQKNFGSQSYGIVLSNINWQPVDISFRISLLNNVNVDDFRKQAQINISKYLDFRFWDSRTMKVDWANLLEIVRTTPGAKYVPDNLFYPNVDQAVDKNMLPRLRGFVMSDLSGNLITGTTGQFSPTFYPNDLSQAFITSVLTSV